MEHGLRLVPLRLAADLAREFFAEHRGRPSLECSLDDLPRRLECEDELLGAARRALVVLPANAARRIGEGRALRAALLEDTAEPVDPRARGMSGDRPDRPIAGPGPELQLLVAQTADRVDETAVVLAPALIERSDSPAHSEIVRVGLTKVRCLCPPGDGTLEQMRSLLAFVLVLAGCTSQPSAPAQVPTSSPIALPSFAQLSATSGTAVWALVAGTHLSRSLDRGDTWVERSLPPGVANIEVSFADDTIGVLLSP